MKRLVLIGLAALAFGLVPARPAEAQAGFIRWLEKLSGPGHFWGAGAEVYGLCVGHQKSEPAAENSTAAPNASVFASLNCGKAATNRVVLKIGGHYSGQRGNNNLTTDDPDDITTSNTGMVTADLAVHQSVEIGTAYGYVQFLSFTATSYKPIWEVVRITVKPGVFKPSGVAIRDYRRAGYAFRFSATLFRDLDALDFGAPAGSYHKDKEWRAGIYGIVNFHNVLK
jgi:hypothetical protein